MVEIELGNEISDKELDKRIGKIDFLLSINFNTLPSKKSIKIEIKARNKEFNVIYAHFYPEELILNLGCKFRGGDKING